MMARLLIKHTFAITFRNAEKIGSCVTLTGLLEHNFYHQLVFTVMNNTGNATDFLQNRPFSFWSLLWFWTAAACFTSGMQGHFYTLWPRYKGEFRVEAPDCASSRGWDGWVSPIADPLLSTDQPQPHVSRPAPAVEVLLIFHNSLQGPRHKSRLPGGCAMM